MIFFFLCFDVSLKIERGENMKRNAIIIVILVLFVPQNSANLFEIIRLLLVFDTIRNNSSSFAIKIIIISILKGM